MEGAHCKPSAAILDSPSVRNFSTACFQRDCWAPRSDTLRADLARCRGRSWASLYGADGSGDSYDDTSNRKAALLLRAELSSERGVMQQHEAYGSCCAIGWAGAFCRFEAARYHVAELPPRILPDAVENLDLVAAGQRRRAGWPWVSQRSASSGKRKAWSGPFRYNILCNLSAPAV